MFIIATIGFNSLTEEKNRKIILAGADIIRYNFAYHKISSNIEYVKMGKKVIEELNSTTKIMIDLPSHKVRLGYFDDVMLTVKENQELIIKSSEYSTDCLDFLPVETENIGLKVKSNQTITIGDGEVAIKVEEIIDEKTIKIRVLNNGVIKAMKTFNAGLYYEDDVYLKKCQGIIEKIKNLDPDYLAISYLSGDNFNKKITGLTKNNQITQKIIGKIETELTEEEIENIYTDPFYNMVIVDLGELGVNLPFEKLGTYYKKIMTIANKYNKKTIAMTQIMESAINNYTPNRAEIINLTNMVKDGIDGIVLCHETALGDRPSYTIHVAKKIINEAQKQKYAI